MSSLVERIHEICGAGPLREEFQWYDGMGHRGTEEHELFEVAWWHGCEIGSVETFGMNPTACYPTAFDERGGAFEDLHGARRWVESRCLEIMAERGAILAEQRRILREKKIAALEPSKPSPSLFARVCFWRNP